MCFRAGWDRERRDWTFVGGKPANVSATAGGVHLPSSVVLQMWNDVLAVTDDGHNGGYDFTSSSVTSRARYDMIVGADDGLTSTAHR